MKFCTVAPFILSNNFGLIYIMTSIIYSNLGEKFAKIQRDIICNPCACLTGYEFKYFKSIVQMSTSTDIRILTNEINKISEKISTPQFGLWFFQSVKRKKLLRMIMTNQF